MAAQKKSVIATERDATARTAWQDVVATLLPEDLIFVDETSTHTSLTRRRARAPRGQRAVGQVPRNHGANITLLATLTPHGIGPALTLEGGVTGAAFAAYAAQLLAPSLRPGQVVILDNLSAHKSEAARLAIEAAGARLLFLPAYSPDFNPIELAFSKIKASLRAAAARSADDLLAATASAIDAVSTADARGFYKHCGFTLSSGSK